ncbi:MAG: type I restriction enzyme HsdR N-terminal domain-containing protein [Sphingopyxis sp.]|uniref:type I restriction endonuclease n=1 Tax=Sphingopyxis sp. TaxID=1908224 RepID=UPI002AB8F618|nr:type I restriction endonuclease [Sphingopyxis sp.]MDZ3830728.1 type I restriction enzyme HsdR N-terminal domain-containing protein [Sphingopyxis sp.]
MDLEAKLADLAKVIREHREVLLTEEAAKNALVMPFIQALGYNVFNPSEVVPEFTCDVGTKKGEKVDYAICNDGKVSILIECKPVNAELNLNHASQLFRYFSTREARIAILTNGVEFKFFSDIDTPNKMDEKPFFTFQLDAVKKADVRTLSNFVKGEFDIEKIVAEASNLKMQTLVAAELDKQFADPSDEFVKLIASRVHDGKVTAAIKERFKALIVNSINSIVRDKVNARLTSALQVSNPLDTDAPNGAAALEDDGIVTTQDEIDGFNILRAIGARFVDPARIVMRDQKSYCAILLDDNNRRTIARLHFNSSTARYFGSFVGKEETRHPVAGPIDLYRFEQQIADRIAEISADTKD